MSEIIYKITEMIICSLKNNSNYSFDPQINLISIINSAEKTNTLKAFSKLKVPNSFLYQDKIRLVFQGLSWN